MKFNLIKPVKLQEGGQVMSEGATQPTQDPTAELQKMASQIIQQLGPEASSMLAQMIMQMLQGAQEQQAPAAPAMQRKGGRITLVSRK